jgi:hypothetical protein
MIFESFRNRESIPEILALQPRARDNIFLADPEGFERELGKISTYGVSKEYRQKLLTGDLSRVEASERLLERLADITPHSKTFVNEAQVTGSLPIVPAFLAGVPQNMRLRRRQKRPAGPLAIFLETTASGGASGGAEARGAVLLALARLLGEYRPTDLWVCTTYGEHARLNALLVRVETRPMDLARAAHLLGALGETAAAGARLFYSLDLNFSGGWSYGVPSLERKWCGEIFSRFLQPGSDVLYVPAAFLTDNWRQPERWLREMLVQYGGETVKDEEDEA